MFNLSDVVALAKAGYSVKDVKELIEMSKSSDVAIAGSQPEQVPAENLPETPAPEKPAEDVPKESTQPADVTDYKALYEAEKAKVSDLQNKNNRQDVSGNAVTSDAELLDIVKSFC